MRKISGYIARKIALVTSLYYYLVQTLIICFVVLPSSNVWASWRNGKASDLTWAELSSCREFESWQLHFLFSIFHFFFFLKGLLFQKFLEQFQKFLEHLLIVFWTIYYSKRKSSYIWKKGTNFENIFPLPYCHNKIL